MTPGQRQDGRTGIRQVAERAGVAVSSVSRVLSGHPNVSKAMRRRVLLAVADLGYEPDLLAQGLRRGETMTVGFVVGDISNPLLAEIALGAETSLGKLGYSMLLANSQNDPR
ncbi:MAG: LacI family DNA-binding transcriptional regulator, partial [Nocardioidaceae bacterium]